MGRSGDRPYGLARGVPIAQPEAASYGGALLLDLHDDVAPRAVTCVDRFVDIFTFDIAPPDIAVGHLTGLAFGAVCVHSLQAATSDDHIQVVLGVVAFACAFAGSQGEVPDPGTIVFEQQL